MYTTKNVDGPTDRQTDRGECYSLHFRGTKKFGQSNGRTLELCVIFNQIVKFSIFGSLITADWAVTRVDTEVKDMSDGPKTGHQGRLSVSYLF